MDFWTFEIAFLVFCFFYPIVSPQCFQRKPDNVEDKEFPNIFDLKGISYTTTVEINYYYLKQSLLAQEYYNFLDSNGRVDLMEEGNNVSFIYFDETNEVFTVKDFSCETKTLSEFLFPYDDQFLKKWIHREEDRSIIGPSAIFRKAYLDYKKGNVIYMGKSKDPVRGILAEFWQECMDDSEINVEYYFAVEKWKNEYGEVSPIHIPLRIEVQGETNPDTYSSEIFQTYEFVNFMPYVEDSDTISIPAGKGCKRLAKNLPAYKTFTYGDLSYFTEIIYTPQADKHSYITNVNFIYDDYSKHVAFHYANWTKPTRSGERKIDKYDSIIYSIKNGFYYDINEDSKTCKVSYKTDMDAVIRLPDGIELPIGNELFLEDDEKFKFLGKKRIENILTDIFEYTEMLDENVITVTTRYFVARNDDYEGRETPVKSVMKFIDKSRQVSTDVIINIFDFSTKIRNPISSFDVDVCFKKSSENQWISFFFEVYEKEDLLKSMENYIPNIQSEILNILIDRGELTPLRISKVVVDIDIYGLHVSALILERPNYMLDFEYDSTSYLEEADDTIGMVANHECAKLCLEYPGMCYAFSHCGKTCYLKTDKNYKTKHQSNCKFYKRTDKFDPFDSSPTLDTVLEKLSEAFDRNELSISLSIKDISGNFKNVELKVSSFDSEANDPYTHKLKIDDFDKHYNEYKYGYKLKKTANYVSNRGSLTYTTCQKICLADPECESLSSCLGIAECLFSKKHGDEIPSGDFIAKDDCIVITRNYADAFIRHDGLIMTSSAKKYVKVDNQELCAKACLNEIDFNCRSFDFCPYSKDPNNKCVLHQSHYLNQKESGVTIDVSGMCGHYSRNYVYDFKKLKRKTIADDSKVVITGVTVDECAKLCVENGGFICGSFDFCQSASKKSQCKLSKQKNNEMKTMFSTVCDTYYRSDIPKQIVQETGRQYSTGLAGGLGVLFFLIGMAFSVVVILAFGKITGRKI